MLKRPETDIKKPIILILIHWRTYRFMSPRAIEVQKVDGMLAGRMCEPTQKVGLCSLLLAPSRNTDLGATLCCEPKSGKLSGEMKVKPVKRNQVRARSHHLCVT